MDGLSIVTDRALVDMELLLQEEPSLPEASRLLNQCEVFASMLGDRNVAAALLKKRGELYDITLLAVSALQRDTQAGRDMILYLLDYIRAQGGRYVEAGARECDFGRHVLLVSLGFRVVGVWKDHYHPVRMRDERGNILVNRDLIRYRLDLIDPVRAS